MRIDAYPSVPLSSMVGRTVGGGTPPRGVAGFWGGEIPWASVKDFSDDEIDLLTTVESITLAGLAGSAANVVPAGTPIICTRMAVGRCAACSQRVAINQDLKALEPAPGVDGRFLLHALKHLQPTLEARAIGSTVKGISLRDLLSARVIRPALPEQRRIAEILDTLDEAIRKTEQVIAKLQQMKQGLLHDLLTRGIDGNGELRDPDRHPEQFKDSPLGRIPRGWEILTTLEIAKPEAGSTTIGPFGSNLKADDYRPIGVPVVFVRDVREKGFEWNSEIYVSQSKARTLTAHAVKSGDVLATKMGMPPCVATTYPSWMLAGIVTADIIRLRPNLTRVRANWASTYLNNESVRAQVRRITGGVTRPKVTLADFRKLQLAVPPLVEQDKILGVLMEVEARLDGERGNAGKLRTLKHGLMDDLLTGRVRVPVAEDAAR